MGPQNPATRSPPPTTEDVPGPSIPPPSRRLVRPQPVESPSWTSLNSVDSVPVIGVFPLGSLHVNEPKDDIDPNMDPVTPLTIPDGTPDASLSTQKGPGLLHGGDVLILDDLPNNFTVGCDTISFTTTRQFFGFRDIPSGAHLVWAASSESTSSRSACWIVTPEKAESAPGVVYIKQWDKFNEVLSDPASLAEERIQKEGLEQTFASLSPYQLKAPTSAVIRPDSPSEPLPDFLDSNIWSQLTFAIQPSLLGRITGSKQQRRTWPVSTTDRVAGETSLPEEARLYPTTGSQLQFTFAIDQRLFDTTAEGSERTRQALDPTSWIVTKIKKDEDLIGELQFAFLVGMHLGNYSCLDQWWYYSTRVVFRSYRLAAERPQLARNLIQTFHAQLFYNNRYLEGDIMDTIPGYAKKLQKALTTYKSRLTELLLSLGDRCTPDQKAVGQAFEALETWLWRLDWDLRGEYVRSGNFMLEDGEMVRAELSDFESEDERGDFAAVVMHLDEDGRPTDLVAV
ncbi:AAR2 protein [Pseudomassariella vexata]|uniref:AAR2 protein n=1 Tax=Pseudomassariella vexata TaxID=1141098 RepID=A0A1Y2EEM6_9PEZI|nr:AAR2 protein [Pseudomassariella vexata]ORY70010.1 AAR2 protein [Pseudomassariella vexata]